MKLISMTDFVLLISKQTTNEGNSLVRNFNKIKNYAQFLKQSLKLEMLVPCDENGNILEEPVWQVEFEKNKVSDSNLIEKSKQYEQAKEKVLFEGFEVKGNYIMYYDFAYMMKYELEGKTVENIIDEIPNNSLQLTPNALKQFL